MKVWTKFCDRISGRQKAEPNPLELFVASMETLAQAHRSHIADLRTLTTQSHERERELAKMVGMVMEERFYRPTITRPGGPIVNGLNVDPDILNDVAQFDPDADAEQIKAQSERAKVLEQEFAAIAGEEAEYRSSKS